MQKGAEKAACAAFSVRNQGLKPHFWGFCGHGMIGQRQLVRVIVLDFGTVYASSRSLVHSQAWMYVQTSQVVSVKYHTSFEAVVPYGC